MAKEERDVCIHTAAGERPGLAEIQMGVDLDTWWVLTELLLLPFLGAYLFLHLITKNKNPKPSAGKKSCYDILPKITTTCKETEKCDPNSRKNCLWVGSDIISRQRLQSTNYRNAQS